MRSLLLLLPVLLTATAACLVHGADEPITPRRSLTFVDLIPTRPRSESDKRKCLENMLALCGSCKHELFLASLFPERHVPFACCRAADEVDDHCGPLTRTFFRAVLPRGIFQRCARQVTIIRAPTTTVPSVSGGREARAPPVPEAQTSIPPPRAAGASGGATYAAPAPKTLHSGAPKVFGRVVPRPVAGSASVHPPPQYPVTVPSSKRTPSVGSDGQREAGAPRASITVPVNEDVPKPKVISAGGSASGQMRRAPGGVHGPVTGAPSAPVASGSPHAAGAPRSSGVPVNEDVPKPKVISTGGSAGGRARRAPAGVYGAATSPPLAAAVPPPKGTVENAGGSATGQTRHAPGGYGPATDY